jgi:hypothetical protein
VGFESTIPVFKRAKTVHALDRAATVIDCISYCVKKSADTNKEILREFLIYSNSNKFCVTMCYYGARGSVVG